jgi:hypothetical protein
MKGLDTGKRILGREYLQRSHSPLGGSETVTRHVILFQLHLNLKPKAERSVGAGTVLLPQFDDKSTWFKGTHSNGRRVADNDTRHASQGHLKPSARRDWRPLRGGVQTSCQLVKSTQSLVGNPRGSEEGISLALDRLTLLSRRHWTRTQFTWFITLLTQERCTNRSSIRLGTMVRLVIRGNIVC